MQLYFDFTQNARRSSIAAQLRTRLGEAGWAGVTREAMGARVPKKHHHGILEVRETIAALSVSGAVRESMGAVYEILAQAEAQAHGCAVDDTHFHEVGEGESLLNTLMICSAFAALHPDFVAASPVQTGCGTVQCAHGLMDIPTPATAAILATGIPTCSQKLPGELCTPTSAAIIKHFVDEFQEF